MPGELTHFDDQGASRMVDVGPKAVTARVARASGRVRMLPATLQRIKDRGFAKGDVLEVARLAGIMAAKRTGELIPLCHPLPLFGVCIDFAFPGEPVHSVMARSPDRAIEATEGLRDETEVIGRPAVEAGAGSGDPRTTLAIEATVRTTARTGVEMEALTAVTVAALTVYDMCKSVDRSMVIEQIQLEEKSGGKSGHFARSVG
jgi:cyclic pyranopterin phosphate synthase